LCEASILHWGKGTIISTNDQHLKEMNDKMDEILEDVGEVKEGVENLQVELMNSIQDLLKEVKSQVGEIYQKRIFTQISNEE